MLQEGVKTTQILRRFSTTVAFDGLWLQNGRTYRKPILSFRLKHFTLVSSNFYGGLNMSKFGLILDEALQFQNYST